MKKVLFLMFLLFLIVSGTANLKAQVTIGSDQEPRDGAILDLSQVNSHDLGFRLPRVSLVNVTDWQLQGDSTHGAGMLVYNTNPYTTGGNGRGMYIRTDAEVWAPLKPNLSGPICSSAPETPGEISFEKTSVNRGGTFTATFTEETGPNRPAFYEWTLPTGLTNSSPIGYARSSTIRITGEIAGRYEEGSITVVGINACDTSAARINSSAVTVLDY
ncbi:MAG: hypothetical protein LBR97_08480 [Dysgonamonadaceae bacterium]|nr:hypothetical protein [Dysgonamonadaceae bacterium]